MRIISHPLLKKSLIGAASIAAATACATGRAQASGWRFDPARCPDLVEDYRDRAEDRRDRRVTWSRADLREDRRDARENIRDESVTVCPASSWVWTGPGRRVARPAAVTVRYDGVNRFYYRPGLRGGRVRIVVQ